MTPLLLALVSAFFLGFYDLEKKRALLVQESLPTLVAASYFSVGLAFLLAIEAALTSAPGEGLSSFGAREFLFVSVKSLLVSSSWIANYHAQKHLPLSIAAPLRATSPILTVFLSVGLLGERLAGVEWLGIALVIASYFSLSKAAKLEDIRLTKNPYVGFLALGTILASGSGLYDKILLGEMRLDARAVQVVFCFENAVFLGLTLALVRPKNGAKKRLPLTSDSFKVALFLFLADVAYFHALAEKGALVSLVSATRRTSVVVAFLASGLLLKERNLKEKAWSVALALLGVLLLLTSR